MDQNTQQPNINQQFQQWIQQQTQARQGIAQGQQPTRPVNQPSAPQAIQDKVSQQTQQGPAQPAGTPATGNGIDKSYNQAMKALLDLRASGMQTDALIHAMEAARAAHFKKNGVASPLPDGGQVKEGPYQAQGQQPNMTQQGGQGASVGWNDFVNMAKQIAQQKGFPPQVLLAQAALESARGKAAPGNNFFGIKGSGSGGSQNLPTQEATPSGQYHSENANFAGYKTPQDAIQAYINLIQNSYGIKTQGANPLDVLKQIKAHGYATSPTYVQDVANTPEFRGGT